MRATSILPSVGFSTSACMSSIGRRYSPVSWCSSAQASSSSARLSTASTRVSCQEWRLWRLTGSFTICSPLRSRAEMRLRTLLRSSGVAVSSRTKDGSSDSITSRASPVLALWPSRREEDKGEPGRLVFAEPKNASRRTVDLPQRALAALKSHRKRQLEEKLGAGGSYEDSGLVFATAKGTPLDAQNVVNRHFKPLLRRAGLPDIRWHDLRHSCFTLLLSRGVHPNFVQHLAGHASIQLTLDRYSHWMPSMGKHTASAMDEVLDEDEREDAPNDGKGALES